MARNPCMQQTLDGDGLIDVLSGSSKDDKIAWYRNEGGGAFSNQGVITMTAGGAKCVYAADLDGDGLVDVLSASDIDDRISWYRNEGAMKHFVQGWIAEDVNSATSVHAADLDGDGLIDVLSASSPRDTLAWYRNEGSGVFSTQRVISSLFASPSLIHVADLDGDGLMDVMSAAFSKIRGADIILWCHNRGPRGFSCQEVTEAITSPQSVSAADFDNDGLLDLLSASSGDRKVAWYRNEGGGVFPNQRIITIEAEGVKSAHSADLDGDGLIDVLITSDSEDKIAWFRNEGAGLFSSQRVITKGIGIGGAMFVHVADLDNDGRLDVLCLSADGTKVLWYRNDGGGAFSLEQVVSASVTGISSVYAADLDRDGRLDVLSAGSDGVMWHPQSAFATISLSSNSTIESYAQLNRSHSSWASTASTDIASMMIHIESDMRIVKPWLLGTGFSFEVNGHGAVLQCDTGDDMRPCIEVLARQSATFRNFTIRGNSPTLLAAQFVRFLHLEHVTFQRNGATTWLWADG